MRCSVKRCTASGIVPDSELGTIPGRQCTIPLRYMLRCARETAVYSAGTLTNFRGAGFGMCSQNAVTMADISEKQASA
jgi:hypothetical protein